LEPPGIALELGNLYRETALAERALPPGAS
jgi:hypothetical protein